VIEFLVSTFGESIPKLPRVSVIQLFGVYADLSLDLRFSDVRSNLFLVLYNSLLPIIQNAFSHFSIDNIPSIHSLIFSLRCSQQLIDEGKSFLPPSFLQILENFLIIYNTILPLIKEEAAPIDKTLSLLRDEIVQTLAVFVPEVDFYTTSNAVLDIVLKDILPKYEILLPHQRSPKMFKLISLFSFRASRIFEDNFLFINDKLIQPTFEMINIDFDSFYQFRGPFFVFLNSVILGSPNVLENISMDLFNFISEMIKFGVEHPLNDVSEIALKAMHNFISALLSPTLSKFGESVLPEIAVDYFVFLFAVMSDSIHKYEFESITNLIYFLAQSTFVLTQPIQILNYLIVNFPTVHPDDLEKYLNSLLSQANNKNFFFEMLKDFLVTVKHVRKHDRSLMAAEKSRALKSMRQSFEDVLKENNDTEGFSCPLFLPQMRLNESLMKLRQPITI
jgi:hypothetical protein